MTKLDDLARLGQSIWLDFIHRDLLDSGDLAKLVGQGLRGMTSNPTIFDHAISKSTTYDTSIRQLAEQGHSTRDIYESLAFADIQRACDMLRPVFDQTERLDGYVSLEVNPHLAHNTLGTIEQVRSYFRTVDRPNLMIKIPATREGVPAIEDMLAEGININVTLMFSIEQLNRVAGAFLNGLERFGRHGGDVSKVSSVSSFFVSRMDSMIDPMLEGKGGADLLGKLGIANARLAYHRFRELFAGARWRALQAKGARIQRVLWGSTSTKNPAYPDTMYVDELIGPDTVNTVPPETLQAFLDHGLVERTVDRELDQARAAVARLAEIGVDMQAITDRLLDEGVVKFEQSFQDLMDSLDSKRQSLVPQGSA
jgi:transaldolase